MDVCSEESLLLQYEILEKLVTCMLLVFGCPVFKSQLHLKLCFESTGLIAPKGSWGMGINACGHKFTAKKITGGAQAKTNIKN